MYTKDKLTRITLRLNPEQFAFVKQSADLYGVSPSEFLRMLINVTLASSKRLKSVVSDDDTIKERIQKSAEVESQVADELGFRPKS